MDCFDETKLHTAVVQTKTPLVTLAPIPSELRRLFHNDEMALKQMESQRVEGATRMSSRQQKINLEKKKVEQSRIRELETARLALQADKEAAEYAKKVAKEAAKKAAALKKQSEKEAKWLEKQRVKSAKEAKKKMEKEAAEAAKKKEKEELETQKKDREAAAKVAAEAERVKASATAAKPHAAGGTGEKRVLLRRPPVADATSSVNSKRSRGSHAKTKGSTTKESPLNNSFSSEGSQPARKKVNQALFRSSTKRKSRNRQEKNNHETDTDDSDASTTTDDDDEEEDGQNGLSDLTGSITSYSNNSSNVRSTSSTSKESTNERRGRRSRSKDRYRKMYKLLRDQLKDAKKNVQAQTTCNTAGSAARPIEETQQQTSLIPDVRGETTTQTAATSTLSQHALPPAGQLPPQQSAPHPMIPTTFVQYQQPPGLIQQMHQQSPGVAMVVGQSHTTIGGSAPTLPQVPCAGLAIPMATQQGVPLHQPTPGSFVQYQQCPQSNGLVQIQTHHQPTATMSYTVPSGMQFSGQHYNVFYH
jgi:hypothetical protein